MSPMNPKDSIKAIWDKVPDVHCKGLCIQSCGPIMMSNAEAQNLQEKYGFVPKAAVQDNDGNAIDGLDTVLMNTIMQIGTDAVTCSALKDGKCSVYEDRPLICRLFGAIRGSRIMPKCPYGCRPDSWLLDRKAKKMLDQMDRIQTG